MLEYQNPGAPIFKFPWVEEIQCALQIGAITQMIPLVPPDVQ